LDSGWAYLSIGLQAGDFYGTAMVTIWEKPLQFIQLDLIGLACFIDGRNLPRFIELLSQEINYLPMFIREKVGHFHFISFMDCKIFIPVIRIDQKSADVGGISFLLVHTAVVHYMILNIEFLELALTISDAGQLAGASQVSGGKEFPQVTQSQFVSLAGDVYQGAYVHLLERIADEVNDFPVFFGKAVGNLDVGGHTLGEVSIPFFGIEKVPSGIDTVSFAVIRKGRHES
jgi:hypothetical protein